jgi:hypothetical protein
MVMLIINDDRPISGAEKVVLARLRKIRGPGIVLSGCYVPGRTVTGGRQVGQEVDAVLITPRLLAAIEVKGIVVFAASGVLTCGPNGRWTLPSIEGDPVHVRASDTNPLDQVTGGMYGLKDIAETVTGSEVFVPGLVAVVPNKGAITLDKGRVPMPTGRDVILDSELADWLTGSSHRPRVWDAAGVYALLDALGLAETVTYDAVVAAGFTAPATAAAEQQAPPQSAPAPARRTAAPKKAAPKPRARRRRPARRRRGWTRPVVLAAAVICLIAGLRLFGPVLSTAVHSVHGPSATAPAAPAVAPPAPAVQQAPPPPSSVTCYPFQTGC